MTTIAGSFGTLCALRVETDADHIDESLEALAGYLMEFAQLNGLNNIQLTVLVDPSPEMDIAH